ncbi:MAG: hypothetical protein H6741_24260 [Alphaproteobacteria bacterium]|nr:hypothetical protein [Alphaproteobacteria bacterium]
MELSLSDAARLLGKTPRQLRYLIKMGKVPATKADNGRWVLKSEELPLSEGQLRARARHAGELREAVEAALGPHLEGRGAKPYSVRETAAFAVGRPLHRRVQEALDAEHPASRALTEALVAVSRGVHRYHDRDKHDAYVRARERAAEAVALLYLSTDPAAEGLGQELEAELMPALTGLVRRVERRRRE